jgi:hypothetical protein
LSFRAYLLRPKKVQPMRPQSYLLWPAPSLPKQRIPWVPSISPSNNPTAPLPGAVHTSSVLCRHQGYLESQRNHKSVLCTINHAEQCGGGNGRFLVRVACIAIRHKCRDWCSRIGSFLFLNGHLDGLGFKFHWQPWLRPFLFRLVDFHFAAPLSYCIHCTTHYLVCQGLNLKEFGSGEIFNIGLLTN